MSALALPAVRCTTHPDCACPICRQVTYAPLRRRFDALPVADQANLLWDFIDRAGAHDQTPAFFDWFAVQGEAQG